MRLAAAHDVLDFAQDWGMSLDPEEEAEWQAAHFRVLGLAALDEPPKLSLKSTLTAPSTVEPWEQRLLGPVVREFMSTICEENVSHDR